MRVFILQFQAFSLRYNNIVPYVPIFRLGKGRFGTERKAARCANQWQPPRHRALDAIMLAIGASELTHPSEIGMAGMVINPAARFVPQKIQTPNPFCRFLRPRSSTQVNAPTFSSDRSRLYQLPRSQSTISRPHAYRCQSLLPSRSPQTRQGPAATIAVQDLLFLGPYLERSSQLRRSLPVTLVTPSARPLPVITVSPNYSFDTNNALEAALTAPTKTTLARI